MADKTAKLFVDIISRGGAAVAADVNRILKDTQRSAAQTDKAIEQSTKARLQAQTKAQKQAADDFLKQLKRVEAEEKKVSAGFSRLGGAIGGMMSKAGGAIAGIGATLSAAVTVPLVALGTISSQSAIKVDDLNNKLISATGSIERANQKIAEFRKLSADSVGVLISFAAETYSFLKPMQIGEGVINKFTQALGRIKLTDSGLDSQEFSRNMTQLFTQNFEMQDLKQLVGRFPRAAELIARQFGFKSSDLGTIQEGLQGMKKAGKLTLESFLEGFSESVENDPALGKLTETFGSRLAKAAERLNLALAPLGAVILGVIVPALEYAAPYLESLFNWFSSLSPIIQTVVVAIGGFVAALGPVLVVIGGVIAAIASIASGIVAVGGLVVVLKVVGIAVAAVIGIFIQLTPAILTAIGAITALYLAWQTNFGGIRDYTLAAWNVIKTTIGTAMTYIYGVVQAVGGSIVAWWRENYPQIRAIIENVSNAIKSYIQSFLNAVIDFWMTHGERIKSYVSAAWDSARTIILAVMQYIGDAVKIGLKVLQGDWQGAWQAFIKGTENLWRNITAIFLKIKDAFVAFFKAIAPLLGQYFEFWIVTSTKWTIKLVGAIVYFIATLPQRIVELAPKFYAAGLEIVAAIWRGIREGWSGQNLPAVIIPTTDNQNDNRTRQNQVAASVAASVAPTVTTPTVVSSGISDEDAKKRAKEREEAAKRDAAAQIAILQNQIAAVEKEYEETLQKLREKLKETGDGQAFADGWNALANSITSELNTLYSEIEAAEDKQAAQEKKRASELELLRQEQQKRRDDFQRKSNQDREENYKLLADQDKKASDQSVKNLEEEANRKIEINKASSETRLRQLADDLRRGVITEKAYATEVSKIRIDAIDFEIAQLKAYQKSLDEKGEKYAEISQKIKLLDEQRKQQLLDNAQAEEEAAEKMIKARDKLTQGDRGEKGESAPDDAPKESSIFGRLFGAIDWQGEADFIVGIGQMISDTFNSIANAVGNAIAAFVKFGSVGGSFRKFAAELIASVAQMAAVQAVWNLAEGFAKLAMAFFGHPTAGAAAAMHFKAAAVYGAIAIGAAIIGRGVAGNEFKNQTTSQGFASSAQQSTSGGGNRQSGAYSPREDGSIEVSRNSPAGFSRFLEQFKAEVTLRLDSNGVIKVLRDDVRRNGETRGLILNVVEGS